MKDDRLYLIHIGECLGRINAYLDGIDHNSFKDKPIVQDAVIRNLQVMCESTQKLSEDLKDSYPSIDWKKISGFRNVLVHGYLGLDIERIWNVLVNDLPSFRDKILEIHHDKDLGV